MFIRHIIVVIAAMVLATVGAAASVFAAEPEAVETAGAVTTCGGGRIQLNAEEERTLRLHNQVRESRNIGRLCVDPALSRAARSHSADILRKDRLSHSNVGHGENIGLGSGSRGSPESIFRSWMKSRGHRSNILNGRFQEVGVGTATGTYRGTNGVTVYTVNFRMRR